ncbi:MAG: hypothetical protein IH614_03930 [Desulfuromonadales bacterium]|nr:hypothetical protein [Desulfuromonadales bacterium]
MKKSIFLSIVLLLITICPRPETAAAETAKPVFFTGVKPTPQSMTVYGLVIPNDVGMLNQGLEIGVFDSQGTLCGASVVNVKNGGSFILQIYGDDLSTPALDEGAQPGERLYFNIYSKGAGKTIAASEISQVVNSYGNKAPRLPLRFEDRGHYGMDLIF